MGGGSSKPKASEKSDRLENDREIRQDDQDGVKQEVRLSVQSVQSSRESKRSKSVAPDASPLKTHKFDENNIR